MGRHSGSASFTPADASLQRWGRDLGKVAPAIADLRQTEGKVHESREATVGAMHRLAAMGEGGELPADRALAAEAAAIAAAMRKLQAQHEAMNKEWAGLEKRAETLPGMYQRSHVNDETRVNSPRRSRAAEKRADVTAAEKDI